MDNVQNKMYSEAGKSENNENGYRPIALASCISKTLEKKIIQNRLNQ